jgi:hypothetical protein
LEDLENEDTVIDEPQELIEYGGYEKVMAWLESLRGVAISGVVKEARRLVESQAEIK